MSTLDINTPRGQQTRVDEDRAVRLFEARFPGIRYVHTDKAKASKVDAILVENNIRLRGLVLTSCRYHCTRETLRGPWNNEWLVTWEKLETGARMAEEFGTPLIGFLYFADEDCLLFVKLYDEDAGGWQMPIRRDHTLTQATVNGGKAVRLNGFIGMEKAREIKPREDRAA